MWDTSIWSYMQNEGFELFEWAKCGEGLLSVVPTGLWAAGSALLSQRLLAALFRRFVFRRVPLWELILQHLLFIWMVIYSLHFWAMLVRILKTVVEYCFEEDSMMSEDYEESRKMMQQWMIWMCGAAPLAIYIHTRPRPEMPPLMIWITTSPWQRREMGPYGYYLNRPLSSLQSSTNITLRQQALTMRRAFSDSKIIIKEPPKKKRHSKSV
ncbi:uncharacterized protein LOC111347997 isoform X1 [Spodoptera litura]|uniref:Uncharacterized protein LOC111347997 isoform X1 n=1 Tax=Spodoptera litura TaxID=69820 RepID=A0A9J7DQ44_SPOLT|nr:uncharacterized protein LOC111347997 isoform X1 [Spodoptera litura]